MQKKQFFNTVGLQGEQLQEATDKAITQTEAVKTLFAESIVPMSASDAWRILTKRNVLHPSTPLTSIRRSISVLTKENFLQRTETLKTGIYNASEHYYSLKLRRA